MKKLSDFLSTFLAGIATVTFIFCVAGNVDATTIDFDNLPGGGTLSPGTILTTQYSSIGVTFSAWEAFVGPVDSILRAPDSGHPSNYWVNSDTQNLTPNRWDVLFIYFDSPVENVSWLTTTFGDGLMRPATFRAQDASHNTLEEITYQGDWSQLAFTVTGITEIDVLRPDDPWWRDGVLGLDDLSFEFQETPVPVPSAMLLFGTGLAGLFGFRKKFRKI